MNVLKISASRVLFAWVSQRQGSSSGFRWVTFLISVTSLLMRVGFCILAMGRGWGGGCLTAGITKEEDPKANCLYICFFLSLWASFLSLLCHSCLNLWVCDFRKGWARRKRGEKEDNVEAIMSPSSWKEFGAFLGVWKYMQRKHVALTYFSLFDLSIQEGQCLCGNWAEFPCNLLGSSVCQQILKNTLASPQFLSWDAPQILFPNPACSSVITSLMKPFFIFPIKKFFKCILLFFFHEAFLSTLLQQVTLSLWWIPWVGLKFILSYLSL